MTLRNLGLGEFNSQQGKSPILKNNPSPPAYALPNLFTLLQLLFAYGDF